MTTTVEQIFDLVRGQAAQVDEVIALTIERKRLWRVWRENPTPTNEAALDAAIAAEDAAANDEANASRFVTEWTLGGDVTFWPSEVRDGTAWQTRAGVRAWRDAFVAACRQAATVEEALALADATSAQAEASA